MDPAVTVIIPAYNRAHTLGKALDSLVGQTYTDWEALVIDDGSTDDTASVAKHYASKDSRIRLIHQTNQGVASARQNGTNLARGKWLLYLDSDDWIEPQHLERLTGVLAADPGLDAVYCGWDRVTPGGKVVPGNHDEVTGDLFHQLARGCIFAIHACLIRSECIEAAGGWDASYILCEDWDLWQRVARTGAIFGAVPDKLALYRMSPDAASIDSRRMLEDGLSVIQNGFGPDQRVRRPAPQHEGGRPRVDLPEAQYEHLIRCAGLELGKYLVNGDTSARFDLTLLEPLKDILCPNLDSLSIANNLFKSIILPGAYALDEWIDLWPTVERSIEEFLTALENQSGTQNLVKSTLVAMERLIAAQTSDERLPSKVGSTYITRITANEPLQDLRVPSGCERFFGYIHLEGRRLGTVELPVCDGLVSAYVLSDAIASRFAWELLGAYFARSLYPSFHLKKGKGGWSLWRGRLRLADGLDDPQEKGWSQAHDLAGWAVLLQELWGQPHLPDRQFYDSKATAAFFKTIDASNDWVEIEVSDELPAVRVAGSELEVLFTVGGSALGAVKLSTDGNLVRPEKLRAELTAISGYELCVAAVRAGLIGIPFEDSRTLRQCLQSAPAPAAEIPDGKKVLLGRRDVSKFGLAASRRAALPALALPAVLQAAQSACEPVSESGSQTFEALEAPDFLFYMPEVVDRAAPGINHMRTTEPQPRSVNPEGRVRPNDRSYFESLFAERDNPWRYTSHYEQTKYEHTLSLLPPGRLEKALELACAEGHFTVQLAPHVGSLIAADISKIALQRAAERCAGLHQVSFQQLDLVTDPLPETMDLIVCSEVLYYMGSHSNLERVARKLARALTPGGYLLTTHARLIVDEPEHTGFDWEVPYGSKTIGKIFQRAGGLTLLNELRTPLYRVQLFQRPVGLRRFLPRPKPQIRDLEDMQVSLLPDVADHVVWKGTPRSTSRRIPAADPVTDVYTYRLPILMYHRIAPNGTDRMQRYRLSPEGFEEQLRYLKEAGYHSVSNEDWTAAVLARRPLEGKAVMLTFDDGYMDFAEHAWPLLNRYQFTPLVFLVAGEIGGYNRWDAVFGEQLPLMNWSTLQMLQKKGVRFGAHTLTHPRLTSLSFSEVVQQFSSARAILEAHFDFRIDSLAYPYGDHDPVIQHLAGACGFNFGFTCNTGRNNIHTPLLALNRIEVSGEDSLEKFIGKLAE